MFRFTRTFGRHSQASRARVRRPRSFNASLEAVEDRTLMSTLSAISWNSSGLEHTAVFGINANNAVSMSEDGGSFISLGGYAKQISAGLDTAGNPEVYAIGGDNAVYVSDNTKGFVDLGGYVTGISATTDSTLFARGEDPGSVYVLGGRPAGQRRPRRGRQSGGLRHRRRPRRVRQRQRETLGRPGRLRHGDQRDGGQHGLRHRWRQRRLRQPGSGFVSLGGDAKEISAGLDAAGKPEVYAIGRDNAVYVNDDGKGWVDLGGYATAISATADGTVFTIGRSNVVYVNRGSGFVSLGGDAKEISAGLDAAGNPEVYAIGGNNAAYVDDDETGLVNLGGYVTEISATTDSTLFARGEDITPSTSTTAASGFGYVGEIPLANPLAAGLFTRPRRHLALSRQQQ